MSSAGEGTTRKHSLHDRALGLLSVRARSREEVRDRLVRAGFEREAVTRELDRLEEVGLLDDQRFAAEFTEHAVRVKGAGRRNIASGLIRKGIPREVVSAALEGIDDGSEEARADDLARARARRLRDLEPRVALQRLTAYLARRGYEVETARTAARRALETHEATE